jgi:hypothetical protein
MSTTLSGAGNPVGVEFVDHGPDLREHHHAAKKGGLSRALLTQPVTREGGGSEPAGSENDHGALVEAVFDNGKARQNELYLFFGAVGSSPKEDTLGPGRRPTARSSPKSVSAETRVLPASQTSPAGRRDSGSPPS